MSSVHLCSQTNSQPFTTCCNVAICDDERQCPRCKAFVYPDHEDDDYLKIVRTDHERRIARWGQAYAPWRNSNRRASQGQPK